MKLLDVCGSTYQKIRVYLALIPARLDYSQNLTSMPTDSWTSCRQELDALLSLLLENPDYIVQDAVEEYDDMVEREPEEVNGKVQPVRIAGSIVGLVENLDNEVSHCVKTTFGDRSDDRISSPRLSSTQTPTRRAPSTWTDCERRFLCTPLWSRHRHSSSVKPGRTLLLELS